MAETLFDVERFVVWLLKCGCGEGGEAMLWRWLMLAFVVVVRVVWLGGGG